MPLIALAVDGEAPMPFYGSESIHDALRGGLETPGPVIVMIHGYKFSPASQTRCPHRHILAMHPIECWKAHSWPRKLGFGTGNPQEGLGLTFGWHATGTIWQAYAEAERAGRALARLIAELRAFAPRRPVHVVAHSLGARVILSALKDMQAGDIDRVILLNGAEYGQRAQVALQTPAGQSAKLFKITTRENDVFDFLFERVIVPPQRGDKCLTHGLSDARNLLTIEIDRTQTLLALRSLGFAIADPEARMCHWSSYARPGVFDLYRTLLRQPDRIPVDQLRAILPTRQAPRWSRMIGLHKLEGLFTSSSMGSASHRSQTDAFAP